MMVATETSRLRAESSGPVPIGSQDLLEKGSVKMGQNGWRPMTVKDVGSVKRISDAVHGRYTERAEVYAERLALYPAGCFVFDRDGSAAGYLICHPWQGAAPPRLNAFLGAIPTNADCFYLHDLALLPSVRGTGAGKAATGMAVAAARAGGFREVRLVAVNGAESFWITQGFIAVVGDDGSDPPVSYGAETRAMRRSVAA